MSFDQAASARDLGNVRAVHLAVAYVPRLTPDRADAGKARRGSDEQDGYHPTPPGSHFSQVRRSLDARWVASAYPREARLEDCARIASAGLGGLRASSRTAQGGRRRCDFRPGGRHRGRGPLRAARRCQRSARRAERPRCRYRARPGAGWREQCQPVQHEPNPMHIAAPPRLPDRRKSAGCSGAKRGRPVPTPPLRRGITDRVSPGAVEERPVLVRLCERGPICLPSLRPDRRRRQWSRSPREEPVAPPESG